MSHTQVSSTIEKATQPVDERQYIIPAGFVADIVRLQNDFDEKLRASAKTHKVPLDEARAHAGYYRWYAPVPTGIPGAMKGKPNGFNFFQRERREAEKAAQMGRAPQPVYDIDGNELEGQAAANKWFGDFSKSAAEAWNALKPPQKDIFNIRAKLEKQTVSVEELEKHGNIWTIGTSSKHRRSIRSQFESDMEKWVCIHWKFPPFLPASC